ncbi:MAG: hypothetical protein KKD77_20480 [Gammaproteobacteria bacterium]|nr:hypothetical protein [Gammaproteobacteria bacterium]
MRQLTDTEVQENLSLYGDCSNSTIFRAASKKQFQADCKDLLAKPVMSHRDVRVNDKDIFEVVYFVGILFTEEEYAELKRQVGEAK